MAVKDMVGKRYGNLFVIEVSPRRTAGWPYLICQCDCGNVKEIRYNSVQNGVTKSCGCRQHAKRSVPKEKKPLVKEKVKKKYLYNLPVYIRNSLLCYGNTFISNKIVDRFGVKKVCEMVMEQFGIDVKLEKSTYNDWIAERKEVRE